MGVVKADYNLSHAINDLTRAIEDARKVLEYLKDHRVPGSSWEVVPNDWITYK